MAADQPPPHNEALTMAGPKAPPHRVCGMVLLMLCAAGLGGCNDAPGSVEARATGGTQLAARPGISPSGATVAFASLQGAPAPVISRFTEKTYAEAAHRDVVVTQPGDAKYLLRGYLSAYPAADGTSLVYVWDLFDAHKQRIQRVEDAITLRGTAADPWSLVDDRALASIAAKGADDLAAVLTNMPEAVAAAAAPAPAPAAYAAAPAPVATFPPAGDAAAFH
jgi:hypothetical protein